MFVGSIPIAFIQNNRRLNSWPKYFKKCLQNVIGIFCFWYSLEVVNYFSQKLFILDIWQDLTSLVIRQKGEYQSWWYKKTKHAKFQKNEHLLPPDAHTHVCVSDAHIRVCIRGKSFFEKSGVLCFLKKFLMVLQSTTLSKTNPCSDFIFLFFIEKNNRKSTWKISVAVSQSSS